jgi:monofunctional biosynthetic peptidoglycan transglycosylase
LNEKQSPLRDFLAAAVFIYIGIWLTIRAGAKACVRKPTVFRGVEISTQRLSLAKGALRWLLRKGTGFHVPRKKKKENDLKRLIRFLVLATASICLFTIFQVLTLRFVNPPFTLSTTYDRVVQVYRGEPWQKPAWQWVPLDDMSAHLKKAVLASEDQRFLDHYGFDFIELKIVLQDLFTDGNTRGASTITMQTARTIFLLPNRSLIRKLLEAYYTVLIEILWDKRRIFEVYMNTVDWGKHILGAEAAARSYFKRPARALTREQAALLAAILPSPRRWSPIKPSEHVLWRQKRIMAAMEKMPEM